MTSVEMKKEITLVEMYNVFYKHLLYKKMNADFHIYFSDKDIEFRIKCYDYIDGTGQKVFYSGSFFKGNCSSIKDYMFITFLNDAYDSIKMIAQPVEENNVL